MKKDQPPPRPKIACIGCGGTGVIVVERQTLICGPCIGRGWRHG